MYGVSTFSRFQQVSLISLMVRIFFFQLFVCVTRDIRIFCPMPQNFYSKLVVCHTFDILIHVFQMMGKGLENHLL